MMRGIHHPLPVQFLADAGHHPLHPSRTGTSRPAHARKVEAEGFGIRLEIHPLVVRQSAQPRSILAGRVETTSRQLPVVLVHSLEHPGITRHPVGIGCLPLQTVTAHHPHPLSADGGIGQHGMRVGTDPAEDFPYLPLRQMVKVHHGESRPPADVNLPFTFLKAYRHRKTRAGRLLPVGCRFQLLRTVVTEFFGMVD